MRNILFICKQNQGYQSYPTHRRSSGLFNSTKFVADAIGAKVVIVNDNNDIDREVTLHKPDAVVIEALWVVPEKFDVLKKLHPNVEWSVHIHSNVPFLANEGIAVQWLEGYAKRDVEIIVNCKKAYTALTSFIDGVVTYLPNIYPTKPFTDSSDRCEEGRINVACFGAIRPMKNQLTQALAAIKLARDKNLLLFFHINSSRVETNGESILKNLRSLFQNERSAFLVEHPWEDHKDFIATMRQIDLGMQVSLSETFNIVTADMVSSGIPVVVSSEVPWISKLSVADPSSVEDIVKKMRRALFWRGLVDWNNFLLWVSAARAKLLWRIWAD